MITGDPCVRMRWDTRGFEKYVARPYGIMLKNWLPRIRFRNLSHTGAAELRQLRRQCAEGVPDRLYFVRASSAEITAECAKLARAGHVRHLPRLQAPLPVPPEPAPGQSLPPSSLPLPPRYENRNYKRRLARSASSMLRFPPRYVRNGPKSAKVVEDELDIELGGNHIVGHAEGGLQWDSEFRVSDGELTDDPIEDW